jgi:16S rRNA (guanine527-N7)-methyltransferase
MDTASQLHAHLQAVLLANQAVNLTRITGTSEAIRLHILDSFMVEQELTAAPQGVMADLGSGAGYPGIPLSITTHRKAVLVESVGKKAAFLEQAIKDLRLSGQISVYAGRSEDLARSDPHSMAVVVARAVAPLPSLVELAAPLLGRGGLLVAMKANVDIDELEAGRKAADLCGLVGVTDRAYVLPGGVEKRRVISYRRTGESTICLPRRVGMARKRPLA